MTRDAALTWSWLNILTKKRYDALERLYGDLDTALGHVSEELLRNIGCRDETVLKTLNRLEEFDVQSYERELKKRGIVFLSIKDTNYPDILNHVPDQPIFLYYQGDLTILRQPCLALVGTRAMSGYGKRVVEVFVPAFVAAGVVTVSGLAQGIDAHVASETLAAHGKTVAVLGHGMAAIYPKSNAQLARTILASGGLLMSEFPLDSPPDKYTFPARNRIIAGLSLGTVVLEAGEGSGALITADLSLDYGREVFAVPGQIFDPNFAGCHHVIARGHAKLVTSAQEVLQEIGIVSPQQQTDYTPQNEEEQAVYASLTTMPQTVGDLSECSKLPVGALNSTLTILELQGAAKKVEQGRWVRC